MIWQIVFGIGVIVVSWVVAIRAMMDDYLKFWPVPLLFASAIIGAGIIILGVKP